MAGHRYEGIIAGGYARVQNGDIHGDQINNDIQYNTYYLHTRRSLEIGKDERIGATACIAGLRRIAETLEGCLSEYLLVHHEILELATMLHQGAQSSVAFLGELHRQLTNNTFSVDRAALISVSSLVTSFTNAVLLFDELHHAIVPIFKLQENRPGPSDVKVEDVTHLTNLLGRLTWQNTCWNMQLDILTQTRTTNVQQSSVKLTNHIAARLSSDGDLEARLDSVEQHLRELSERLKNDPGPEYSLTSLYDAQPSRDMGEGYLPLSEHRLSLHDSDFEEVLNQAWVYQRNQHRSELMSFRSSFSRHSAWSELSKLSLSAISILSVIALPIGLSELRYSDAYRNESANKYATERSTLSTLAGPANADSMPHYADFMAMPELHPVDPLPPSRLLREAGLTLDAICLMVEVSYPATRNAQRESDANTFNHRQNMLLVGLRSSSRLLSSHSVGESTGVFGALLMHSSIQYCEDLATTLCDSWWHRYEAVQHRGVSPLMIIESLQHILDLLQHLHDRKWPVIDEHGPLNPTTPEVIPIITTLRALRVEIILSQEIVDLSVKQLRELRPQWIDRMRQIGAISTIILRGNRLRDLPMSTCHLGGLRIINLESNQISRFPTALLSMPGLSTLRLDNNQIRFIPAIDSMVSLECLSISQNQVMELPVALASMNRLVMMKLDGNPFTLDLRIRKLLKEFPYGTVMRSMKVCRAVKSHLNGSIQVSSSSADMQHRLPSETATEKDENTGESGLVGTIEVAYIPGVVSCNHANYKA
ncbi:uncharacterized protein RCC_04986 [Ramularia collo-cygni]|uniref:Uncharacterized protein n=1 Tax=Ramularia collo-cygni TaxID=112498 RepID=A0A2D3V0Y1_9PEZI|nr:uncharacterized protein RCC_04986 [Ramularia collo-cygni]CZT19140.1 uncharacterized protein RCC_04986 [Ramularia collo-cygni]